MQQNILKLITVMYADIISVLRSEMSEFDLCAFRGYYIIDEARFSDEFFNSSEIREQLYDIIHQRLNIGKSSLSNHVTSPVEDVELKKKYQLNLTGDILFTDASLDKLHLHTIDFFSQSTVTVEKLIDDRMHMLTEKLQGKNRILHELLVVLSPKMFRKQYQQMELFAASEANRKFFSEDEYVELMSGILSSAFQKNN